MNGEIGTSPLEFRDDYFAAALSSDDSEESTSLGSNFHGLENASITDGKLRKQKSIISLNDTNRKGILFNNIRTEPTSGLNLENASVRAPKNDEPEDTSLNLLDDSFSILLENNMNDVHSDRDDTLVGRVPSKTGFPYESIKDLEKSDENDDPNEFFKRRQQFFILSTAGKPIYSMHGSYELLVVYSGVIQTIVSFYKYPTKEENQESIKCITLKDAKTTKPLKFVFLDRSPLILLTIIKESDATQLELEQQLDFLYSFIISALSKPYIDKIFNKYPNFDLRNLLGQTDLLTLDSICEDLSNNTNVSQILGGLQTLRMHSSARLKLERKLIGHRTSNLLYGLIIGPDQKLISIVRPKRHTLHTSDLMILFEMIYNTNTFKSKNDEDEKLRIVTNETFWIPLCLPKFNSSGHLYTLIQFHQLYDERFFKLHDIKMNDSAQIDEDSTKIGIVLMSPFKESFSELKSISNAISKDILFDRSIYCDIWKGVTAKGRLVVEKILPDQTKKSMNSGISAKLTVSSIMNTLSFQNDERPEDQIMESSDASGEMIHFSAKNKQLVQCIFPESFSFDIKENHIRRNILEIYKYLRRRLQFVSSDLYVLEEDNKSVSDLEGLGSFKNNIVYEKWINEGHGEIIVGFGYKAGPYEIMIIAKGDKFDESTMIKYSIKILKWCRKQQRTIFIS